MGGRGGTFAIKCSKGPGTGVERETATGKIGRLENKAKNKENRKATLVIKSLGGPKNAGEE